MNKERIKWLPAKVKEKHVFQMEKNQKNKEIH